VGSGAGIERQFMPCDHPGMVHLRRALAAATIVCVAAASGAATAARNTTDLPPEVSAALRRAQVPAEALVVSIRDLASGERVLQWQADKPVNVASLAKLLTTAAALERLGPAYTWPTPVWATGTLGAGGVLEGNVFVKGYGDPKFTQERVWLLLRRLQQHGVREIRGDIVFDSSAFAVPDESPAAFDGESTRPYNVKPAALLFNFRSVTYSFVPDAAAGVARVLVEPLLAGHQVDRTVPLVAGPCEDWRTALKASFEPNRTRFAGGYALACGELNWPVADPQPNTYEARLIDYVWRELGGTLTGSVREGLAPTATAAPLFEQRSPPLAELVRDINKFSNNLMAQQLFLTLALHASTTAAGAPANTVAATPEGARAVLGRWLAERTGPLGEDVLIDNGSGLSRSQRITAARLTRLLQANWESPVMSELMSSLPISGQDGTLRRSRATPGRAHLKTGSLRDVAGVAGYVLTHNGRRYTLVAVVNHPQAGAARPALDALVQWAMRDAPQFAAPGTPP
jgi:serine-type D-Ala-D-Ala carboxypeptidase/endopeptidase (penicillin-binding protein 4)